jgi:hypothetical protein
MADPAPPPAPMRDPRRWLIFVAIAAAIGAVALGRGRAAKSGPNLECLTHEDCAKGLFCYAIPRDDPFATFGVCVEKCVEDLQCEPGAKCKPTAQGKGQLLPLKPGLEPGERACLR